MLYCDFDGVLADFDGWYHSIFGIRPTKEGGVVNWKAVLRMGNIYAEVQPLSDYLVLWEALRPYNPKILTGIPQGSEHARYKREWVDRWLPGSPEVITATARTKHFHAGAGDILIDDRPKYRELWEKQGGVWITHTSANESVMRLWDIMAERERTHSTRQLGGGVTRG